MIGITIKTVADVAGGELFSEMADDVVKGVSIDSRTIEQGQLFVAVKGKNFDGHDHVDEAVEKGACGLILERFVPSEARKKAKHVIVVDDCLRAMGSIAAEIRKRAGIPVVCVAGTNGKTTVKDILAGILSSKYNVLKSKGSYNNIIGLSLTLFDLERSHDIAILELGTNRPGEISLLAEIACPDTVIITNIGTGHLEFFHDREAILNEKIRLLDFLPPEGTAFLNSDDDLLAKVSGKVCGIKFYGTHPGCDFFITDISKKEEGCNFFLNGEEFHISFDGEHNVSNAAGAIALAECLGVSCGEIRTKLTGISLPKMRLEKVSVNGLVFINDSYNANPESFKCALKILIANKGLKVKGVIAGDMRELGKKSEELHVEIGNNIADMGIDFVIAIGEKARYIVQGAIESGMTKKNAVCVDDHKEAVEVLRQIAPFGSTVLLKGSRAARMEEVIKCFTVSCIP